MFILLFFESSTALYNSRIPTVLKTSHKKGGQNILFHSTLNCCFSIVPLFVTRKPIIIKQYVPFLTLSFSLFSLYVSKPAKQLFLFPPFSVCYVMFFSLFIIILLRKKKIAKDYINRY